MYIPEKYRVDDQDRVVSFIRNNPFGLLITQNSDKIDTTHLPFIVTESQDGSIHIKGHMAAANQQAHSRTDTPCKIVFTGPHSYISSSWYNDPGVPTWNYIAVEVNGDLGWLSDDESFEFMKSQMNSHEGLDEHSDTLIKGLIQQVVCFNVKARSIEMCVKMSQSKPEGHIRAVIKGLKSTRDAMNLKVAEIMEDLNLRGR